MINKYNINRWGHALEASYHKFTLILSSYLGILGRCKGALKLLLPPKSLVYVKGGHKRVQWFRSHNPKKSLFDIKMRTCRLGSTFSQTSNSRHQHLSPHKLKVTTNFLNPKVSPQITNFKPKKGLHAFSVTNSPEYPHLPQVPCTKTSHDQNQLKH